MINQVPLFSRWKDSARISSATGESYTVGFPIESDDEDYNQIGQHYTKAVILITDALAFSTADIFAAGFQGHQIGPIIGTDANMAEVLMCIQLNSVGLSGRLKITA